jgi:hypothetical protein
MSNYEYITLNRQDEEAIRSFYEKIPTSGDLHFSLNREPGFFDALEAEGNDPEVLIMRKINSGDVISIQWKPQLAICHHFAWQKNTVIGF